MDILIDNKNIEFLFIFISSDNEINNIKSKKIIVKNNNINQDIILNEIIENKNNNNNNNNNMGYSLYKLALYEYNNNIINYNSINDIKLNKIIKLYTNLNSLIIILKEKNKNTNNKKSRKVILLSKNKKSRKMK
jgi:hypothetical protein